MAQNGILRILTGGVIDQLSTLPDESVHCCVTSPPYWGLRDYGTAQWEGGDTGCDHKERNSREDLGRCSDDDRPGVNPAPNESSIQYRETCGKCGAKRIDSQIGLEKTPEEYVAKMVEVFREVRRVLRKDGTLWLNLGDSYAGGGNNSGSTKEISEKQGSNRGNRYEPKPVPAGLKPKDLCGIPWRVAFALQADGWWLRSDIIWAKPNPMPESVTDRPTKSHEYLFLLTKSSSYFYDAEAIKEPAINAGRTVEYNGDQKNCATIGDPRFATRITSDRTVGDGRNKRSVWTVATAPYPEAHFATYPPDLIKPCILAGTSAKGCCAKCGSPWERMLEKESFCDVERGSVPSSFRALGQPQQAGVGCNSKTIGWQPTCKCEPYLSIDLPRTTIDKQCIAGREIPCTVLDPFAGSGTTGAVALELGRKAILIELNPKYVELIKRRCDVTPGLALA